VDDASILTMGLEPPGPANMVTIGGQQLSSFHVKVNDPGPHDVRPGVDPPFVSADGRRFGAVVDDIEGTRFFKRYQRTLYVWQDSGKQLIFTTPLKYWIIQGPEASLSADGSVLAVVNAQKVLAYSLPVFGSPNP